MQPLTFLKNGPETVMNLNYYLEIKIWHRKLPKGDCKKATEQKKKFIMIFNCYNKYQMQNKC